MRLALDPRSGLKWPREPGPQFAASLPSRIDRISPAAGVELVQSAAPAAAAGVDPDHRALRARAEGGAARSGAAGIAAAQNCAADSPRGFHPDARGAASRPAGENRSVRRRAADTKYPTKIFGKRAPGAGQGSDCGAAGNAGF